MQGIKTVGFQGINIDYSVSSVTQEAWVAGTISPTLATSTRARGTGSTLATPLLKKFLRPRYSSARPTYCSMSKYLT